MSNFKTSRWAVLAVAAGAVVLLGAQTTQAGGFSISIGGLGFGSWNTRCVERTYVYYSDYDDDWGCTRVYRETYRPRYRTYYPTRPYYGGGRFHRPMHHRRR